MTTVTEYAGLIIVGHATEEYGDMTVLCKRCGRSLLERRVPRADWTAERGQRMALADAPKIGAHTCIVQ